jgi:diphthine methyl ester synthase
MARGRKIYEPPRYMTVNQCIEQLLEIEKNRGDGIYSENTICVGLARVGATDQKMVSGTMKELLNIDFGAPLHSFCIPGIMHFLEAESLRLIALNPSSFDLHANILKH